MKTLKRVLLIIILMSVLANIPGSQTEPEIRLMQARGKFYSDSILQRLQSDLDYIRAQDEFVFPPDWNRTLSYMKDRLVDVEFGGTYSCEISKWMIADYSVNIIWNPIKYDPSNFEWLPVYVFLPANQYKKATLASFREMTEKSFVNMPTELSELYRSLDFAIFSSTQQPRFDDTSISISGDSLKTMLPSVSNIEFFLVNQKETMKTRIKMIEFYFADIGPNQITAVFYNTLERAIFAFPIQDSVFPPSFVQFQPNLYSSVLADTSNISVIPTPAQGPVFIGTICSVPVTINILWDPKFKLISQLSANFGVSLGNELPCYTSDYLLSYGGEYFALRISNRCADLIFLKPHDFRVETIADETAPEL